MAGQVSWLHLERECSNMQTSVPILVPSILMNQRGKSLIKFNLKPQKVAKNRPLWFWNRYFVTWKKERNQCLTVCYYFFMTWQCLISGRRRTDRRKSSYRSSRASGMRRRAKASDSEREWTKNIQGIPQLFDILTRYPTLSIWHQSNTTPLQITHGENLVHVIFSISCLMKELWNSQCGWSNARASRTDSFQLQKCKTQDGAQLKFKMSSLIGYLRCIYPILILSYSKQRNNWTRTNDAISLLMPRLERRA